MTKPYRAYLESYDWSSTCRKIKVNVYYSLNIYIHNRIGNTRGNQIAVVQSLNLNTYLFNRTKSIKTESLS